MRANHAPLEDVPLTPELRALLGRLDASLCAPHDAVSLPPECYTSPEWFEFERRAIWDREWICLGHQGAIPRPGDYFPISINDDPFLVVRAGIGEVRVLSAVCQHRGHLLGQTGANARLLVCPYHGWSYDLDGTLVAAPGMEPHAKLEALRADHCLPRPRTEIWNGFVFVNLDGRARPLAPRLKRLSAEIGNYRFERLLATPVEDYPDNPWNWKWMLENGLEPYHTPVAHKGYHEMAPAHQSTFPAWEEEEDGAVYYETRFTHIDASFNDTGRCLLPVIPGLAERDRWRVLFIVVPPNLLITTLSDLAFYFVVRPEGAGAITLRVGFLFPQSTLELPDFGQTFARVLAGFNIVNEQDIRANISIQQGRRSRFAHRGRIGPLEMPIDHLNRWYIRRYREYARELERRAAH
jgi:phenylpropionate dioxygenase-like ring-hydroxylating dioxygenase large terminal subunit